MSTPMPKPEAIRVDPSPGELSEGQTAAIRLFELPDDIFNEELPKFIQARTEALSEGVSRRVISDDTPSFTSFIASGRPLFPAESLLDQQPFVLDDPKAYEMTISRTRSEYKNLVRRFDPAKALINAAVRGSFEAQVLYFGSYYGNEWQRLHRLENGKESSVPGSTSVTVIGDAAMCMERAAIVHNSLLMVGVSSEYCVGGLKKCDNEGKKTAGEGHVFLEVVGPDGSRFLYDPANPKVTEYPEQGVRIARPNTQKLDNTAADCYTVDWTRSIGADGKVETVPDGTWVYYKNTPASTLGRMAML